MLASAPVYSLGSPQEALMVLGQMEAEEVTGAAVGRRVSCGGERATVRYVGPVPPTAGELRAEVKGHLQASVQPAGL